MRISVKGRYALAASIVIANKINGGSNVTVASISDELEISKIYLEQVFSQLKKEGILVSMKGPKGGYKFARPASTITVWDMLTALEIGLTEETESTVSETSPGIELALKEKVFDPINSSLKDVLQSISVQDLADYAERQQAEQSYMMNL
ncbi:MAG: Rrf2 family transcriptional regulator [Clostridiales Family XIII bacterium]|jgi:Rrf2 family protein|nr:Rrf2 family transcriptional regulator [Clostridiales Family XIII bacterium]